MADELCLTLFEPVPAKPGEMISTLFRPTGEFDLDVEMRASVDGQEQVTVCFDGFRVASCSSSTVRTVSTVSVDGTGAGTGETPPWTVDQGEAALWASGAGLAQDDMVGSIREIEAAAHVALEQLAELARYAQSARGAEWQRRKLSS